MKELEALEALAEDVKNQFHLQYDEASVKFIEGFIERQRNRFEGKELQGLVNALGSFIGACMIKNYGGQWQFDEEQEALCVAFSNGNKAYPFTKIYKQLENGLEDSVYSFYTIIPIVFKLKL